MARVIDILNEVNVGAVAEYMAKIRKTADINECLAIINSVKSLDAEDSDVRIIDMIVIDECSTCENPSYSNDVVGYRNIDSEENFYDIADEKWNRILGMEVVDSCFQHLLPVEVVGDILLEITRDHKVSPAEPRLVRITEENFSVTRDLAYKACNVDDDRTEYEKDYDKNNYAYTYHRMRDLFLSMIRIRV